MGVTLVPWEFRSRGQDHDDLNTVVSRSIENNMRLKIKAAHVLFWPIGSLADMWKVPEQCE
jgi:hypothetical protein